MSSEEYNLLQKIVFASKSGQSTAQKKQKIQEHWERRKTLGDNNAWMNEILEEYTNVDVNQFKPQKKKPKPKTKPITSFFTKTKTKPKASLEKQRIEELKKLKAEYVSKEQYIKAQEVADTIRGIVDPNSVSHKTNATSTSKSKAKTKLKRKPKPTPVQTALTEQLNTKKQEQIESMKLSRMYKCEGFNDKYHEERGKQDTRRDEMNKLQQRLKKIESKNKSQQQWRHQRRQQELELKQMERNGQLKLRRELRVYDKPGKPSLEDTMRGRNLRSSMKRVADPISDTDPRRRTASQTVNVTFEKFADMVNEDMQTDEKISSSAI
eukprot:392601_1